MATSRKETFISATFRTPLLRKALHNQLLVTHRIPFRVLQHRDLYLLTNPLEISQSMLSTNSAAYFSVVVCTRGWRNLRARIFDRLYTGRSRNRGENGTRMVPRARLRGKRAAKFFPTGLRFRGNRVRRFVSCACTQNPLESAPLGFAEDQT